MTALVLNAQVTMGVNAGATLMERAIAAQGCVNVLADTRVLAARTCCAPLGKKARIPLSALAMERVTRRAAPVRVEMATLVTLASA